MGVYAVIDQKSFYASVECAARGLDPLRAHLVVADQRRSSKTICLAVSPAMKALGLPGRCRLFEVEEKAREVLSRTGKPLEYIVAPPRMRLYMRTSTEIYEKIYLRYFSPEDVYAYSIDEVFLDLSKYLRMYQAEPKALVRKIILDIQQTFGLIATGGIGTNLFLAKVAMDILSKHEPADESGVRIAELDEAGYRRRLWNHTPITDFWRIAKGTAKRLNAFGVLTMGDLARLSLTQEDALFRAFGVNAELLIDHAWGHETCTLQDIRAYQPRSRSLSEGQVLPSPYPCGKARLIVMEMVDQLALDMLAKGLKADMVSLAIGYDSGALELSGYTGAVETDYYGRPVPAPAHGTQSVLLSGKRIHTNAGSLLRSTAAALFDRIVDPSLPVRRIMLAFLNTISEDACESAQQLSLFAEPQAFAQEERKLQREQQLGRAAVHLQQKYGKNALLKAMSLQDGATARDRNRMVGGHAEGEENGHDG